MLESFRCLLESCRFASSARGILIVENIDEKRKGVQPAAGDGSRKINHENRGMRVLILYGHGVRRHPETAFLRAAPYFNRS